jgi:hypothetical protein
VPMIWVAATMVPSRWYQGGRGGARVGSARGSGARCRASRRRF